MAVVVVVAVVGGCVVVMILPVVVVLVMVLVDVVLAVVHAGEVGGCAVYESLLKVWVVSGGLSAKVGTLYSASGWTATLTAVGDEPVR